MDEFKKILLSAKEGSVQDFERLVLMYRGFLRYEAVMDGKFDEDLYQEALYAFWKAIQRFPIEKRQTTEEYCKDKEKQDV